MKIRRTDPVKTESKRRTSIPFHPFIGVVPEEMMRAEKEDGDVH
jgi:hypothetical protein